MAADSHHPTISARAFCFIVSLLAVCPTLRASEVLADIRFGTDTPYPDQERFEEDFEVSVTAGNFWRVGDHLHAPAGQNTTINHREGVSGFSRHCRITLTMDARLGINWQTGPNYGIQFQAFFHPEPLENGHQPPDLSFEINYVLTSFGEESEYSIHAPRNTPYIWHPASLYAEQDADGPGTHRWLRWQAVWSADPEAKTLQLTLTVFDLGPDGKDEPRRITAFAFDPVPDEGQLQSECLYFGLRGRASNHFGLSAIKRILIEGENP